ncbi:MAG TPA: asparagine synthase-related protein [Solirubrobacterales bacterium]
MSRGLAGSFESGRLTLSGPEPDSAGLLCVLDGHLDNAAELGAELGVGSAAPSSPGPLLAAGYRRWGLDLPGRMRGDFVLVLWDRRRGEGLLAHDQLGARPLFLHETAGCLRFATEVRDLLALLPRRPGPDPACVAHWLALGGRPGRRTLFAGVRRLGPGEMVLLDRRGFRERRYWKPRFEAPLELPPERLGEALREGLERAVERRIGASGATAVTMSGGLDSSSVAALCAARAPDRVLTCSAVFPEHPEADESELIAELRRALELPGIVAAVRPGGLLAGVFEHIAAWQLPPAGWGDPWSLALLHAARERGAETVLDGDGGDELFAPRNYLLADRLRAGHPLEVFALARRLPGGAYAGRREVAQVAGSFGFAGALPARLQTATLARQTRREAPGWLRPHAVRELIATGDPLAWKRLDGPRWWAHAAHGLAYEIEAAGVFEHQRRRAAMAGLAARHPMLDLDLVELGLRQPPRATLDPRFNRPLLRQAMVGLLPDSIRLRPGKAWFQSLIVDCLTGPDGELLRRILADPKAELGAYVDMAAMRRDLLEDERGRREEPFRWMWQVWRLLTAECWLRAEARGAGELASLAPLAGSARVELGTSEVLPFST